MRMPPSAAVRLLVVAGALAVVTLAARPTDAPPARAAETPAAPPAIDFNRQIRPILSENCFACHGPDEKQRKAKLRLDVRDAAMKHEGLIVPGKPAESE